MLSGLKWDVRWCSKNSNILKIRIPRWTGAVGRDINIKIITNGAQSYTIMKKK